MIAYLKGKVFAVEKGLVYLETIQGIGYEVYYTGNTTSEMELYTSQIFREKSVELYGFRSFENKKFFEKLILVNGVGPKSAYSLISAIGVEDLKRSILFEDIATIKKAPGIGPKAAKQIILDMKDKIDSLSFTGKQEENSIHKSTSNFTEALVALKELGFAEAKIIPLMQEQMSANQSIRTEDLVKDILKRLN
jgi:Holliday junction DNA helicase RuvA